MEQDIKDKIPLHMIALKFHVPVQSLVYHVEHVLADDVSVERTVQTALPTYKAGDPAPTYAGLNGERILGDLFEAWTISQDIMRISHESQNFKLALTAVDRVGRLADTLIKLYAIKKQSHAEAMTKEAERTLKAIDRVLDGDPELRAKFEAQLASMDVASDYGSGS